MRVIAIRPDGQHNEIECDLTVSTSDSAYGPHFRIIAPDTQITMICMPDSRERDALAVLMAIAMRRH